MPLPPPTTLLILVANVAVSLLAFSRTGALGRDAFVFVPYQVARGRNLRGFALSHLSHADGGHLLVNMLGLYFFGPVLERGLGPHALALVYVLSGLLASAAVFVIRHKDPRFRVLGASGSVAGVLFAAIVLRPDMDLYLMFVPIPVPAPLFAVLYVVLSSYFMGRTGSRVCHEAHVGGAVTGMLLAGVMSPFGFSRLLARVGDLLS
jgi:membrane associated rhomboid family serine protease